MSSTVISRLLITGILSVNLFIISSVYAANDNQHAIGITHTQSASSQTPSFPASDQVPSLYQLAKSQPQQSVRLLVKLEDMALLPYLKQERTKVTGGRRALKAGEQQQLAKLSQNHQQKLRNAQQQLLDKMRQEKLLGQVHHQFIGLTNTLVITARAGDVARIEKLPRVMGVYLDNKVQAMLEQSVPAMGIPEVWQRRDAQDRPLTGAGIKVAVLDTGIDHTHPDLGGCLGPHCKVVAGYNLIEGEDPTNAMDRNGHGTHVAGIVAAKGELMGVAPDVSLYAFKVLDDTGTGVESGLLAALERLVDPDGDPLTDDAIDVANMSLVTVGVFESPLVDAANAAMEAGVVVVAAAGNQGNHYATVFAPGTAEKVITVGAVDRDNAIADFSSRGPVPGKDIIKPDLVAPGFGIKSTIPNGGYEAMNGTSMATPHVAGAAALLLQSFPDASPADIKARLVSGARSLGTDLFYQGAGLLDIAVSLDLPVVANPQLLSLGYVDIHQAQWQNNSILTLKNLTSLPQTVTMENADEGLPGVVISLSPSGPITLEPGTTAEVSLQIQVDNTLLPYSLRNSLHHESALYFTVSDQRYAIPFALFKAAQLSIDPSAGLSSINLYATDGSYNLTMYIDCEAQQPQLINVKPGEYHGIWMFSADDHCGGADSLVLRRNIQIEEKAQINVNREEAIHHLRIGNLIGSDGKNLTSNNFTITGFCMAYWDTPMEYQIYMCTFDTRPDRLLKINALDSDFSLNYGLVVRDDREVAGRPQFAFASESIDDGLAADHVLNLDMRDMGKLSFDYLDPTHLEDGVMLQMGLHQIRGVDNKTGIVYSISGMDKRQSAFGADVYFKPATLALGEWYTSLKVISVKAEEEFLWASPWFETGVIGFIDSETYFKMDTSGKYPYPIIYESQHPEIRVADTGYYLSGYFQYETMARQIITRDFSGCPFCYGLQKDEHHNIFGDPLPYRVYCGTRLVDEGILEKMLMSKVDEAPDCDIYRIELDMETRFMEKTEHSSIEVLLNKKTPLLDQDLDVIETPSIRDLVFLDGGEPTRILKGDSPQVRLLLAPLSFSLEHLVHVDVQVAYRLGENGPWTDLVLTRAGDTYTGNLPVLDGSHIGSLKVLVADEYGNQVIQTLNAIFMLGKAAEETWFFPQLPDLQIEASGPLTSYQLPLVVAQNRQGAGIPAATDNTGPYVLGEHQIQWRVVSPGGEVLIASQRLSVVDTTPPAITVNRRTLVNTTNNNSVANPDQASALDLVDGVVAVVPDKVGPFAVGQHAITWSASDASGNTSHVTQTLVVTATTDAPAPKKKSGGGHVDVVMVLMLLSMLWIRLRATSNRWKIMWYQSKVDNPLRTHRVGQG